MKVSNFLLSIVAFLASAHAERVCLCVHVHTAVRCTIHCTSEYECLMHSCAHLSMYRWVSAACVERSCSLVDVPLSRYKIKQIIAQT